jgi:hypothetical protein
MAGKLDITIEQGADFKLDMVWETGSPSAPVNLTSYTARFQIATRHSAATPLVERTQAAGIALGGAAGTIVITLTEIQTAALPAQKAVWDLILRSPAGEDTRLLEGTAIITPEVPNNVS